MIEMTKTDPWSESLCLLSRQLVKFFSLSGGGTPPYCLPVHLHLPGAPQGGSGWVVVVVDHTADVVHQVLGVGYLGGGTGVVDVPLTLSGPEVTVEPEGVPLTVGLNRVINVSHGKTVTLRKLSRRARS